MATARNATQRGSGSVRLCIRVGFRNSRGVTAECRSAIVPGRCRRIEIVRYLVAVEGWGILYGLAPQARKTAARGLGTIGANDVIAPRAQRRPLGNERQVSLAVRTRGHNIGREVSGFRHTLLYPGTATCYRWKRADPVHRLARCSVPATWSSRRAASFRSPFRFPTSRALAVGMRSARPPATAISDDSAPAR